MTEPRPAAVRRHRRRLHRARACSTRATSTRSRFCPGCRRPASARCVTLYLFGNELNIYSFVGLIMLIGIVKKNAIMQIDFALEAERQHGKIAGRSDLRRVPDPLPADHDDDDGGAAGRGADRARLRRRRRSAPPARPRRRRRAARVAADHALSDAGGLHLHGRLSRDQVRDIFSMRSHSASDTGITDSREILTSAKVLERTESALISLSVTGPRAASSPGRRRRRAALPAASSGSG